MKVKKIICTTLVALLFLICIIQTVLLIYAIKPTYDASIKFSDLDQNIYAGIPVIEINTENNVLPKDKENYINCSFNLWNTENSQYDLKVEMKKSYGEEDSVGIRLRGNSTFSLDKKPYRIKFENKQSLLGKEGAKSWVLLADYFDDSKIRNYSSLQMGNEIFDNLDFVPTGNHVVLSLNGYYKGLYLLTEQIDENKGRTNVETNYSTTINGDYSFPFLVEIGSGDYIDGINGFKIDGLGGVEIKYPDFDQDNKSENSIVFNYIKEYISTIFHLLKNSGTANVSFKQTQVGLLDLLNEESFIDWHLLNEFVLNRDASHYSIFISKKINEPAVMGPIWDFDTAGVLGYDFTTTSFHNLEQKLCIFYNSPLLKNYIKSEENFNKIKNRWYQLKDKLEQYIREDLLEYKQKIYLAAVSDSMLWGDSRFSFDLAFDDQRMFLLDRITYLTRIFDLSYENFLNEIETNHLKY